MFQHPGLFQIFDSTRGYPKVNISLYISFLQQTFNAFQCTLHLSLYTCSILYSIVGDLFLNSSFVMSHSAFIVFVFNKLSFSHFPIPIFVFMKMCYINHKIKQHSTKTCVTFHPALLMTLLSKTTCSQVKMTSKQPTASRRLRRPPYISRQLFQKCERVGRGGEGGGETAYYCCCAILNSKYTQIMN